METNTGWEETARFYARNDEYYHKYRDELLLALKAIYDENPELALKHRPDLLNELALIEFWENER